MIITVSKSLKNLYLEQHQQVQHSKMLVAIDWYEMKLTDHFMGAWNAYTRKQKLLIEVKMQKAQIHYNWFVKDYFITKILYMIFLHSFKISPQAFEVASH